jgi:hypothetical protein
LDRELERVLVDLVVLLAQNDEALPGLRSAWPGP